MVVRIRWESGAAHRSPTMRNFAMAVAALLTPAALLGFTITIWSLGAGQHWTAAFFISSGPFAHWQTWLVASLALFVLAVILNRFAASREHYSG